jgi:hypothetical protein
MRFPCSLFAVLLAASALASEAADLLERLERGAFDFFWNETHPATGLTKDRAGNFREDDYHIASVAATGFGLAALAVGAENGWVARDPAIARAKTTLSFVRDRMEHHRGWLYHFVDWRTGDRAWKCEVSSIDTALLIAGALMAGEYFGGETKAMAEELHRRIDFPWMLTDGGARPGERLIGHGWKPETGFLKSRWDNYSEHLVLNLLALGSPTHPLPAGCWDAWERNRGEYGGFETFACAPLFTHQYSHAFIDFRGKRDRAGFDYFESAVQKTKADRQFCVDQSSKFKTYGPNAWGLSACDAPGGHYKAYGSPPGGAMHDGTISVWSTISAVAFAPDLALQAVEHLDQEHGRLLWGRYGFAGAFNLDENWVAKDVIGIDLGAALLLIENHRSGKPWAWFMKNEAISAGMKKAGFTAR